MEPPTTNEKESTWILSDGFVGALVVMLIAATAFAAFQSALSGIEGDDFDIDAQRALVLGTTSFLTANTEFLEDLQLYDAYNLFVDKNPEEAAEILERASDPLIEGLERPGGPFDETYEDMLYADAKDLLNQVIELEEEANSKDDAIRIYELAGLIFAIGLATSAWASLIGHRRSIRLVFVIVSLICLIGGTLVIVQIPFL